MVDGFINVGGCIGRDYNCVMILNGDIVCFANWTLDELY